MHTRKVALFLAATVAAASGQGFLFARSATACDNSATPDCPVVTVSPGAGSIGLNVRFPGSSGSNRGPPGSGGSGGSSAGADRSGRSVAPVTATGGPPAPPPAYVISCNGQGTFVTNFVDSAGMPTQGLSDFSTGDTCTATPQSPQAPGAPPAPVITPAQLAQAAY